VAAAVWNPWLNLLQYLLPIVVALLATRALFLELKPRRAGDIWRRLPWRTGRAPA
jgi:hypothetical protein